MHLIQKELIIRLVLKDHVRFADLTIGYSADDNILFHLRQLIKNGFVKKRDNLYHLTKKGLFFFGHIDLETLADKKFKSAYIGYICQHGKQFLLRERISGQLKFYKFPGAKPLLGEKMSDSRIRLFKQATGLNVDDQQFKYRSTHFKIQYTTKQEILYDDILLLYDIDISKYDENELSLRPGNKWFSLPGIKALEGKWPEIDLTLFNKNQKQIYEYSFVNNYNIGVDDL